MTISAEELVDRIAIGVALDSDDAGIRINAKLAPAGGPSTKVFPPTYAPPKDSKNNENWLPYALESRYRNEVLTETVLLDAQQSQANRVEVALSSAIEDGSLFVPHLRLEGNVEGWPVLISNLTAPHRGPDAYFRDSETEDGTAFDKTAVGQELRRADADHATAFFQHVPSDLLFGFWDSHRGGRGVKVPRCYTSEVIGWDPKVGKRAAGKIDPNNTETVNVAHPKKRPGDFVVPSPDEKAPIGYEVKNPSEIGHGSIPPSFQENAGVSISSAERIAYLSFAGLHRLRFPTVEGPAARERNVAGRVVLACLGLYADRLAFSGASMLLRSGCELVVTKDEPSWLNRDGSSEPFSLPTKIAKQALDLAIARAASHGLGWASAPTLLRPQKRLADLLAATFTRYEHEDN